ncbi:MAG: hypothetical protein ABEH88_08620 [Halobacteriales archaeon]
MPPDGYTTVTISTDLTEKLARIMALHDCSSYAEAIEHTTDKALIQEDEITTQELIQLLAGRLEDVDAVELQ